ncbi:unnamed protein product, partial [Trichobilharzia regenti]
AQCNQLVSTAELAACTTLSDVWRADALRYLASQLNELGGQVVLAGRAVVLSSDPSVQLQLGGASLKQATSDHFLMMRQHWSDTAERMRVLVDEAIDANAFISAQGKRKEKKVIDFFLLIDCVNSIIDYVLSVFLLFKMIIDE